MEKRKNNTTTPPPNPKEPNFVFNEAYPYK